MKPQQLAKLLTFLNHSNTRVFVYFGLSECNVALGCQLFDNDNSTIILPIGYPLYGFRCLLVDEQGETITSTASLGQNKVGQIHLGGE
jgi:hypothetical protein